MESLRPWKSIFWSPKKVAELHEAGALTERDKLWYFVTYSAFAGLMVINGFLYDSIEFLMLDAVLFSLITIIGILYLARMYSGKVSFIERYVIAFTSGLFHLLLVIMIPGAIVTTLTLLFWYGEVPEEMTLIDIIGWQIFYALAFIYVKRWFVVEANPETNK